MAIHNQHHPATTMAELSASQVQPLSFPADAYRVAPDLVPGRASVQTAPWSAVMEAEGYFHLITGHGDLFPEKKGMMVIIPHEWWY